ncbi:hypothetical protein [Streptomyces sp. NPDC002187]|uniref:hypothetical protein n=1 Tax=Streptomyces sp. NPDC002187 TaxID=3364637 RepID=UPI0036B7B7FE
MAQPPAFFVIVSPLAYGRPHEHRPGNFAFTEPPEEPAEEEERRERPGPPERVTAAGASAGGRTEPAAAPARSCVRAAWLAAPSAAAFSSTR